MPRCIDCGEPTENTERMRLTAGTKTVPLCDGGCQ